MKQAFTLGIGLLALAGAALPAAAADLGRAPPPLVAPAVAVDDWSGFYVGLGLGGRWTDTTWATTCLIPFANTCANNAFATRFATDNPSQFDMSGVRVSGYLGYNWQFGSWLVGVEGDFGWADNKETHRGIPGTFLLANLAALTDTATIEDKWDASIRGRLGWVATPQLLLYATGGISWLEKEITASCAPPGFPVGWCAFVPQSESVSRTYVGWTVGGGFEWKLTRQWLVRGEYRYTDYTDDTSGFRFFGGGLGDTIDFRVDQKTHTALLGVTYLFNFAPEAVAPPVIRK